MIVDVPFFCKLQKSFLINNYIHYDMLIQIDYDLFHNKQLIQKKQNFVKLGMT